MNVKDFLLRRIRDRAQSTIEHLAGQFARTTPQEQEVMQAGIEFERWLITACDDAMDDAQAHLL